MGFDDYWADARTQLMEATNSLPDWLSDREKDAFLHATVVVEYLSRYVDRIAGNPEDHMHGEGDPVFVAFGDVSVKLKELAVSIHRATGEHLFPEMKDDR